MEECKADGNKPLCFVAMPFGKTGTEMRAKYDRVYNHLIKMPIEAAGFICDRADKIPGTDDILDMLKSKLVTATLVVVDLSDRNPNVFYELGFRHALNKPTITIANTNEIETIGLPFNIRQYNTIPYDLSDIVSVDTCRLKIKELATTFGKQLSGEGMSKGGETIKEPSLREIETKLEIGLANIRGLLIEMTPSRSSETEKLFEKVITSADVLGNQAESIKDLRSQLSDIIHSSKFVEQANGLGVVSLHRNRLDAIEHEFFRKMQDEEEGIDIVGSTIFGLKGRSFATNDKILKLLHEKGQRPDFQLRILLTHWDYVSGRQAQEKTEKNIARYVISKELLDAVKSLAKLGISRSVRFYRSAPTCFTIICRGQKEMLLNPYPYEREAFNSWSIVFRETYGGIYEDFKSAHFEQPWENKNLTIPFSEACLPELVKRYHEEVARARDDLDKEIIAEEPSLSPDTR
jgi:hypothetical protein